MFQGKLQPAGRILLIGTTGQVGGELLQTLAPLGELITPARDAMNLSSAASIRAMIREASPRWIVNSGAYTAVDKAETEPELAYAINAEALSVIGEEAKKLDAAVIQFSTDYVFDGTAQHPYTETDSTHPVSVYGASKLTGEQALAASGAAHLIVRTSWVYGTTGKNFLLTILNLARERPTVRVVADQHGAPTWSRDLAKLTAHVIAQCESAAATGDLPSVLSYRAGIYHAAAAGETTWHAFATEAVRLQSAKEPDTPFATIEPIPTSDYPTPARRPANSRLNCTRLAQTFGWTMPNWRDSLQAVMAEL